MLGTLNGVMSRRELRATVAIKEMIGPTLKRTLRIS
jgi:hypothetical protein